MKRSRSAKGLTILMADDDADDRMLTAEGIEMCEMTDDVRFVEDGEELMDYLHRRGKFSDPPRSPRPGLIFLDLNMPRKDGREALSEIKADPCLRQIPVIVLTTSSAEDDILDAYASGANSYITKPTTFDGLVQALEALGRYWLEVVHLPPAFDM